KLGAILLFLLHEAKSPPARRLDHGDYRKDLNTQNNQDNRGTFYDRSGHRQLREPWVGSRKIDHGFLAHLDVPVLGIVPVSAAVPEVLFAAHDVLVTHRAVAGPELLCDQSGA